MCKTTKTVRVLIPDDLSHTGKVYWKDAEIDECIADAVRILSEAGIKMRASCCGHGKGYGKILLDTIR